MREIGPPPTRWHLDPNTLAQHTDSLSPTAPASDLTGWHIAHDRMQLDL